MTVDSKFFGIPFATSGDKITIPEAVQPSGDISFTQGFGPDYERDPATDPLAKRVPRDETNELYYQITNSLRYLQLYGLPQYTSVADGGPANYPVTARVRHDAGAGMQAWVSLVAANTAVPGSDATKWALDDAFNLAALEATLAEAVAGTLSTKLITPRRLASAAQQNAWNFATAGGTANALTATLSPAPAALVAGMRITLSIPSANTATGVTLNVNGLGAATVYRRNTNSLGIGDIQPGPNDFEFDGTNWRLMSSPFGASVISGNGWIDLPGGLTMQWGAASTSSGQITVTFPKAFSAAPYSIVGIDKAANGWATNNASFLGTATTSATTAVFKSVTWNGSGMILTTTVFAWIAIGPT